MAGEAIRIAPKLTPGRLASRSRTPTERGPETVSETSPRRADTTSPRVPEDCEEPQVLKIESVVLGSDAAEALVRLLRILINQMTVTEETRQATLPVHSGERGSRRTPRIVCQVPLTLKFGSHSLSVRSAVINAHGALILCPEPIPVGTWIALVNEKTGECAGASVVWTGVVNLSLASPALFQFKIGVEFRQPDLEFWGSDYKP